MLLPIRKSKDATPMTSLMTADLTIPPVPIPDRPHDEAVRDLPRRQRPLVRHRIRLDSNGSPARTSVLVSKPSHSSIHHPGPKPRPQRSCLCRLERALRHSPANLRTTLVILTVASVIVGIMVATLGFFAIGVLVGMSIMYKPLCG